MKKLLALVLALVMSMSLVTISNAADFTDADDIDYTEAVEVLNAVGVLVGSDGKFNPQGNLTRAQACKIIAYLDLGEDVAEALPSIKVFSDVPADNWAAKFVAYCADAGYVSGIGDGKFDPNANVTGYQFGKMLLCALGYDATVEGMTGASWQISVAKLMEENDLAKGVDKLGSLALTREEAAQYALNALKATTVEYDDKGTVIEGNGLTITTGAKKAEAVTVKVSSGTNEYALAVSGETTPDSATDMTVELGEKLYKGKLDKDTATSTDAFGRPAVKWTYKSKTVGTYADAPDFVFTGVTKENAVFTAIDAEGEAFGQAGINLKFNTYTDGKASTSTVYITKGDKDTKVIGNGQTLEVYETSTANVYTAVVITEKLAKVTSITDADEDTNTKRAINVKLCNAAAGTTGSELAFETESFAKKDYVVVTLADNVVKSAVAAKVLENQKVTTYSTNGASSTVTFGGAKYNYNVSDTTYTAFDLTGTYTFYLDTQGNVLAQDVYTASSTDYVQVVNYTNATADGENAKKPTTGTSLDSDFYWEVKYVAMDGTTKIEKVYAANNTTASTLVVGAIYTVEADDDHDGYVEFTAVQSADTTKAYYKSQAIADGTAPEFKNSVASYGAVSFNNDTVFVIKKPAATKYTVVKGLSAMDNYDVPSAGVTAYTVMKDGAAVVAFIDLSTATATTSTDTLVYIYDKTPSVSYDATNEYDINTYKTTDGTLTVKPSATAFESTYTVAQDTGLYIVNSTTDGHATSLSRVTTTGKYTAIDNLTNKEVKFNGNVLSIEDNGAYVIASDATVVMVDSDKNVKNIAVEDLVGEKVTGDFFFIAKSTTDATVKTIYFQGSVK